MKLGSETGSVINHIMAGATQPGPKVGWGATVLSWTDRHAGTIIEVTEKYFVVQLDTATRQDNNGMSESQTYHYAPNPNGMRHTFKKVTRGKRKGEWRESGSTAGRAVSIGHRNQYHDYSF